MIAEAGRSAMNAGRRPPVYPVRTAAEVGRIRSAYVDGSASVAEICKRFGMGSAELYVIIERERWPNRGGASRAHMLVKSTARSGPKPRTQKEIANARRREDIARDRELYGADVDDITWLRKCGFIVNREGAGILVGNKLCTFAEMREIAARERRLCVPATTFFAVRT